MAAGLLASLLLGCDNTATISTVEVDEEFAPFFPIELGVTSASAFSQLGHPSDFGFGDCACADGRYDEGRYAGLYVFYLEYGLFTSPGGNHLGGGWELSVLSAEAPYALETRSGIGLGASRQRVEELLGKPDLEDFYVAWENVGLSRYIQEGYLANDSVAYSMWYTDEGRLWRIEKVLLHFQGRRYLNN
jgi:hypothetical protein